MKVTSSACNIAIKDLKCLFDLSQPYGTFKLDMNVAYERAISFCLLRLAASHERFIFSHVSLDGEEINLVQILSPLERLASEGGEAGLSHLESLEIIKDRLSDKGYAKRLFKRVEGLFKALESHQKGNTIKIVGIGYAYISY
jgi:hypothetical protein